MRRLTREELVSETLHRLALRGYPAGALHTGIVELVAEMIDLAREHVPDCYTQATMTPPTLPTPCHVCDGIGQITTRYDRFPSPCPACQGRH